MVGAEARVAFGGGFDGRHSGGPHHCCRAVVAGVALSPDRGDREVAEEEGKHRGESFTGIAVPAPGGPQSIREVVLSHWFVAWAAADPSSALAGFRHDDRGVMHESGLRAVVAHDLVKPGSRLRSSPWP